MPAFVSMLYNSFRTPAGEFKGINVMSYCRPKVQKLKVDGFLALLERLLRDDHGALDEVSDGPRQQGRELLAYLHSRGLLRKSYEKFRKACARDPSGITAVSGYRR